MRQPPGAAPPPPHPLGKNFNHYTSAARLRRRVKRSHSEIKIRAVYIARGEDSRMSFEDYEEIGTRVRTVFQLFRAGGPPVRSHCKKESSIYNGLTAAPKIPFSLQSSKLISEALRGGNTEHVRKEIPSADNSNFQFPPPPPQ